MPEVSSKKTKSSSKGLKTDIDFSRFFSIPLKEKIVFTKNLEIMMRTGLSISKALKTLSIQSKNKKFSGILTDIRERVERGESFSSTLARYPNTFNELFVSMIESGELGGNLEEVLSYLQLQMKKDHALLSKVRGAMIYPTIVVVAMLGIGIGMMVFVVPKLISIFQEFDAELPLPTKILISLSNFITHNGIVLFIVVVAAIVLLRTLSKQARGKKVFHAIFLKSPILGTIVKKINLARMTRTLSSLIKTDISIIKSITIASKTLGNIYYKQALLSAAEDIKKGINISESLSKFPHLFPPMVNQMITVGEESGQIDEVLMELAQFYEDDIDQVMQNLPQIIEPVLILVLGAGVGSMAVAIIMPLYSITESI